MLLFMLLVRQLRAAAREKVKPRLPCPGSEPDWVRLIRWNFFRISLPIDPSRWLSYEPGPVIGAVAFIARRSTSPDAKPRPRRESPLLFGLAPGS